jgi:hypothetical protein
MLPSLSGGRGTVDFVFAGYQSVPGRFPERNFASG